jgi:chemotaxis protein methyltransferase CheR
VTGFSIPERQFERVRKLSLELAGIQLVERHRELLASRCRRLRIADPNGLDALLDAAQRQDSAARRSLIGLLTICHTSFFRNPKQIEIATGHALRALKERGEARVWCAAASTGEEPYSLAASLLRASGGKTPPVRILATDINSSVLETARGGEYPESALRHLDMGTRQQFFVPPTEGGFWRIADAVRSLVTFEELNLIAESWRIEGPFDVVFCRNILMYLAPCTRTEVLLRINPLLAPDGILILDPAEHLGAAQQHFRSLHHGVYSAHKTSKAL